MLLLNINTDPTYQKIKSRPGEEEEENPGLLVNNFLFVPNRKQFRIPPRPDPADGVVGSQVLHTKSILAAQQGLSSTGLVLSPPPSLFPAIRLDIEDTDHPCRRPVAFTAGKFSIGYTSPLPLYHGNVSPVKYRYRTTFLCREVVPLTLLPLSTRGAGV